MDTTEAIAQPAIAKPALARWATLQEIPIIDFAPLQGKSPGAIDRLAKEVHDAARDIGFFTIVNHPIPAAQIRDIFAQSKRFFALPIADKMALYMGQSENYRGYLPMDQSGDAKHFRGKPIPGFQLHITDDRPKLRKPNLNEAFQISAELGLDDPDVMAGKPLHGPNQWPENLPGFKEGVLSYYDTMCGFTGQMAGIFARGLGLAPDWFEPFYKKPLIQLRLLHYLPHKSDQAAVEGGESRAHCDAGGFTMLQQDDVGGLEIKNGKGEWIVVPPVENSFVVNIGDSLKMWTNHRFSSTLHRVVNRYGRERYSVGIFTNPDYDAVIKPIATCVDAANPPRFTEMTCGDALVFLYSRIWPSKGAPPPQEVY